MNSQKIVLKIFLVLAVVFFTNHTTAQSSEPTKSIDGLYHLTFPEKGVGGKTTKMLIQLAENNGTKMLAVAACEKCFPAIYTYKSEISKQHKKPVFYNAMGLYVYTYDENSFVIAMADPTGKKDFGYLNFYSKNKNKAKTMTKAKMKEYASQLK